MFKLIIPTLAVLLLCNSIATAQYFGTKYPASSSYQQPTQPIRIARASDTVPLPSPSDKLNDLDSLDALDAPAANETPSPATKLLDPIAPLNSPQSLDAPAGLEPPALSDMPERVELPQPAAIDKAAMPEISRNLQPEISANDFDSLEPIAPLQTILEPPPTSVTPIANPIDFNEAIQQQQHDIAQATQQSTSSQGYTSAQYHGDSNSPGHRASNGGCQGESAGDCESGHCTLPYRTPILPPPNSFHGHFRSNPCHFDLWANYPAEAAAACARNRAKLAPTRSNACATCVLVDPRPCK